MFARGYWDVEETSCFDFGFVYCATASDFSEFCSEKAISFESPSQGIRVDTAKALRRVVEEISCFVGNA